MPYERDPLNNAPDTAPLPYQPADQHMPNLRATQETFRLYLMHAEDSEVRSNAKCQTGNTPGAQRPAGMVTQSIQGDDKHATVLPLKQCARHKRPAIHTSMQYTHPPNMAAPPANHCLPNLWCDIMSHHKIERQYSTGRSDYMQQRN
jgi:hypothetical protein